MKTKKELWVDLRGMSWNDKKVSVREALEKNADAVVTDKGDSGNIDKIRELGKIRVVADDAGADYALIDSDEVLKRTEGKKVFYKEINTKEDERAIVGIKNFADYIIVKASDWKVIPLENLIAEVKNNLIVEVEDFKEAKLVLQTLEIGCDGVLVKDVKEIHKIKKYIDEISSENLKLQPAKIVALKQVGVGDRVCVDTCSMLEVGEGLLVGSQSAGLFLVHSETLESEYVNSRPFRVNAGAVHSYVLCPEKTKYLSELSAGDEVLAVNYKGLVRKVVVGRAKIEKRPLILVEAESSGKIVKILLQNAETIRLVSKDGKPVSVSNLKEGDDVMVYFEEGGRHFGTKVEEESIIEK